MDEYENDSFEDEDDSDDIKEEKSDCLLDAETNIFTYKRRREPSYVETTDINGMVRLKLSSLTQKILECEIGENVTTEYPWIFVKKDIIEDNLDLHSESSDFLPVREQILNYPEDNLLIGYAPKYTDDKGHFHVCLTEESRDVVMNQIEMLRFEQQNRIKNSVFKPIGVWRDLGSDVEIDLSIVKDNRELFEIEAKIKTEVLDSPINLVNRNAEEQRDGYIELVLTRQSFNNVTRRLVSRGDQANPATGDNEAQTTTCTSINSWFQYCYEYKPINTMAYNGDKTKSLKKFLRSYTDFICNETFLNGIWDLHTNEYQNLVKNERDTRAPVPIAYTEYQRYHDGKLTEEKVVNDFCWHPLQSGIAIATYTDHSKSEFLVGRNLQDEVSKICQGNNKLLVWSINDFLTPKLILECTREVTAISIRPLDGTTIIGGCSNGQIAIWSLPEKIEDSDVIETGTVAQMKHRAIMKNLMSWMKRTTDTRTIRSAAMSSINNSQKSAITQIIWLDSHNRLDENGQIVELDTNSNVEELGWQFVTSSEDGTMACWDLRQREEIERSNMRKLKLRRKRKMIKKPDALIRSISPFQVLNNLFSPTYILAVKHPNEERRVVITAMNFYVPKVQKVEIDTYNIEMKDFDTKRYYKPVIEKADHKPTRTILIGTLEGDVGMVTWDGFEFTTGLKMNRESVRWIWRNEGIHDGPVTHMVRSNYLNNVILTIGGRATAIWREDFDEPIFVIRSVIRYSACCWSASRPSVFILARADGTIEIWDLIVTSDEPCFTQSLSGRIITGIYAYDLNLKPPCVAFCDFNGTIRLFVAPMDFSTFDTNDIKWMKTFIDREVERIEQSKQQQKAWTSKEIPSITPNKVEVKGENRRSMRTEVQQKDRAETTEMSKKIGTKKPKSKPAKLIEDARARWKLMELQRMQRIILEKKGLRPEDLARRREPVLKLRHEANKKLERIHDMMHQRDRIFEDTVTFLFPERNYESVHLGMTTARSADEEKPVNEETLGRVGNDDDFIRRAKTNAVCQISDEEIIHEFRQVAEDAFEAMKQRPYRDSFDWRKIRDEGITRRRIIDIELRKTPKRKVSVSEENEFSFHNEFDNVEEMWETFSGTK